MIQTVSRQIATTDVARIKTALFAVGIRVAVQVDDDTALLIALADDAQQFADTIATELSR